MSRGCVSSTNYNDYSQNHILSWAWQMVSPKCARTASANPGPCFQTWSTTFLGTGKNGAWWNYTLPVFAFWSAWGNKQSKRSTVRISIGLVATWLLLLHSIYKKDTFIHKSVLREKIHICHLLQCHSILNFWIRLQKKARNCMIKT